MENRYLQLRKCGLSVRFRTNVPSTLDRDSVTIGTPLSVTLTVPELQAAFGTIKQQQAKDSWPAGYTRNSRTRFDLSGDFLTRVSTCKQVVFVWNIRYLQISVDHLDPGVLQLLLGCFYGPGTPSI